MSQDTNGAGGRRKVKLPAILDIGAASELRHQLLDGLNAGDGIDVDASSVQRVTSPCLQVLAAATISAGQLGVDRFRLHSVPQALADAIGRLGLAPVFGLGEA